MGTWRPQLSLVLAYRFLVAIHVFADMLWIGSIVAVGALIAAKDSMVLRARAGDARWIYRRLAAPAFVVALVMGIACIVADPTHSVMKIPSMHVKLTLAAGVIALHHWIGASSRRIASGNRKTPMSSLPLVLLIVAAGGAAILAVLKPF